ncbi:Alpha/Beta hydrolase protein [Mycena epipterygia]|nr:Alpha/Beta hydrolase protein [Mycena epipterygia]
MSPVFSVALLVALLLHAHASASAALAPPTVVLDNQKFTGVVLSPKTESFLGIPFAQPPVGDLRFRRPVTVPRYSRPYNVSVPAPACPQQRVGFPINFTSLLPNELANSVAESVFETAASAREDCLTIDVIKPATATLFSKLPVVVWIFGGGFEVGSSAPSPVNGTMVVERSIAVNEPVLYVAMNHRVSAFGFLASKEVRAAGVGNLGLHDQREALRWVQRYISAFGGDPSKVTLWGDSSGAISVSLQMLTNGGSTEGLFRAAVMQSGAPIPVGPIEHGQKYYDEIVRRTGCSKFSDTLACLRTVDYVVLKEAQDASPSIFSYQSLVLAWLPREDGVFLTDNPQRLVQQGKVARVPIIAGSVDDEGTMFSFSTLNLTTDAEVSQYISSIWLPQASAEQVKKVNAYYPTAPTLQCLGAAHPISVQFKRLAAFQGDTVFQAPRRFFQQSLPNTQMQWAFLSKKYKLIPCLGAFHSSDLLKLFNGVVLTDYLINFATHLDPNVGTAVKGWPKYTKASPQMMTFNPIGTNITNDTYRAEAMQFLTNTSLEFPI